MKNVKIPFFSLALILFLSSAAFAEWASCDDRQVEIKKTAFRAEGVEVYEMSGGGLYVKDAKANRRRFCHPLPVDWAFVGFKNLPTKDQKGHVVVFEVRNEGVSRYFNIDDGKEVLVSQEPATPLVVEDQVDVEAKGTYRVR